MNDNDDDYHNDWKEDLAKAATRFILSVTAMVPFIVVGVVLSVLLHGLFSEPGGFTCKSLPPESSARAFKRRLDRIKVTPVQPAPEFRVAPPAEIPKPEPMQE